VPEPPDISITRFAWRLLPEFSDLLNRLGSHGFRQWPDSSAELRSELEILRADPEQDIALLKIGDRFCGYAITLHERDIDRTVAAFAVTSELKDQAEQLLDWALERTHNERISRIHIALRGTTVEPARLLRARGFKEVTANLELILDRANATSITDSLLLDGFSIRPMRSAVETLLLTRIQNTIFSDHWGFSKNSPEEIQARLDLPTTGPEHVLFVESSDGSIAAYIWTALEWGDLHTCGRIWMMGVMPEFRRSGIGKSVVNTGVKHLLAEGASEIHLEVIEHNAVAVQIYTQMGFTQTGRVVWLELQL
jgi:mycothiol synthase